MLELQLDKFNLLTLRHNVVQEALSCKECLNFRVN